MNLKTNIKKIFLLGFAAVLFAGCENFYNGSLIKDQIDSQINYSNAPYANVTVVKQNVDDNGTLSPAGEISNVKVGLDNLRLSYTASSTYYFLYWQATDTNNNIVDSTKVKFDDNTSANTFAVIYTQDEVRIEAVTSPVPKAIVSFKKNFDASGTISTGDTNSFLLDEEFSISFEPAENYQFIKWQVSNELVKLEDVTSVNTKGIAKGNGNVTVTAICALRPQVGIGNTNPTQTDSVCKDTNIIINFDKALSNPEEELSDITLYLNGVQLYYGEQEAFGNPYYYKSDDSTDKSRIVIPAHSKYSVDVATGKTAVIKVVLPDSIYRIDEETNSRIYLCKKDGTYSWTYKINENTNDKAKFTVTSDSNSGTLKGNSGEYSIGKTVDYSFKIGDSSQFIGWNVTCVPEDIASITKTSENGEEKISFDIMAAGDISVEVVTANRPSVNTSTILPSSIKTGVAFDSDVVIKFNLPENTSLDSEKLYEGVSVSWNDLDLTEYFEKSLTDNELKLSFVKDKILELKENLFTSTATVRPLKVSLPAANVFYKYSNENPVSIKLASDFTYTYNVNSSTTDKTNIKFESTDAGVYKYNGVTATGETKEYSLGETIELSFKPSDEYQFIKWQASDDSVEIADASSQSTKAVIKKSGTLSIIPVSAVRTKFTSNTDDNNQTYKKDTSVVITFDKELSKDNDLSTIKLYFGSNQLYFGEEEAFNSPVFQNQEDGSISYKNIEIRANTFHSLDIAAGKTATVRVVLPSTLYYVDSASGEKIYLCKDNETCSWSYKINEKTTQEVTFETVVNKDSGTFTGNAGDYNLGTDAVFTFKPSDYYQFIGWNITQQPSGIVTVTKASENGVEKVTLSTNAFGSVKVEAVTAKRPTVDSSTIIPASVKAGVSFDTDFSMKITVPEEVSLDGIALLSATTVFSDITDLSEYFDKTLENGELKIKVKQDNEKLTELRKLLFPTLSAVKQIKVTVSAAGVFYTKNETRIQMMEDFVYAYYINSNTTGVAQIKFPSTEAGTYKIDGVTANGEKKTYSIGDTFKLTFKVSDEYSFNKFAIGNLAAVAITETVYDSASKTYSAECTVKNAAEVFEISADAVLRNKVSISFEAKNGRLSQNDKRTCYKNDEFNLNFTPDSDYGFTGWKFYNTASEEYSDISGILKIETVSNDSVYAEINVKVLDDTKDVKIKACSSIRPSILSYTPLYTASGVYRDTRIQVMFDQPMSEGSIFFDENDEEIKNIASDKLRKNSDGKIYGYTDANGDDHYKNISITNLDTKKSILNKYGAPFFVSPEILYIPTGDGENIPKSGIQPYVELSKNFYYLDSAGNKVTMGSIKKWNYRINSSTDKDKPVFEELNVLKSDGTTLSTTYDSSNQENLKTCYLNDGKFKVYAKIFDGGSGPDSVSVLVKKISNGYGKLDVTCSDSYDQKDLNLVVDNTVGYYGNYKEATGSYEPKEFNLKELYENSNGVYDIKILASDVKGNEEEKHFYAVVASKSSVISNLKATGADKKITLEWDNSQYIDSSSVKICNGNTELTITDSEKTPGAAASFAVSGLENGTTYNLKVAAKDIFGNEIETVPVSRSTIPNAISSLTPSVNDKTVTLNWGKPDGNLSGYNIYYKKVADSSYTKETAAETDTSKTFNLKNGTKYEFKVETAYNDTDNTQLAGEGVSVSTFTKAAPVRNLKAKSISASEISLTWDSPAEGTVSGIVLEYGPDQNYGNEVLLSSTSKTASLSTLSAGKDYYFSLKTYVSDTEDTAYNENNQVTKKSTCPAAIDSSTIKTALETYSSDYYNCFSLLYTNPTGNFTGTKFYCSKNENASIEEMTPVYFAGTFSTTNIYNATAFTGTITDEKGCVVHETYYNNGSAEWIYKDSYGNYLEDGTKYYVWLYSYYEDNGEVIINPDCSKVSFYTPPPCPVLNNCYSSSDGGITYYLGNIDESTFAKLYVYYDTMGINSAETKLLIESTSTAISLTKEELALVKTSIGNKMKIYVYDSYGNRSIKPLEISFKGIPGEVKNISASKSGSFVKLSWDAPSDNSGHSYYLIEYTFYDGLPMTNTKTLKSFEKEVYISIPSGSNNFYCFIYNCDENGVKDIGTHDYNDYYFNCSN